MWAINFPKGLHEKLQLFKTTGACIAHHWNYLGFPSVNMWSFVNFHQTVCLSNRHTRAAEGRTIVLIVHGLVIMIFCINLFFIQL